MDRKQYDRKEGRSANSGFAKKRVQWLIEHSTSHQLLCYVDSLVLRNPLLRKAAKRCTQFYQNTHLKLVKLVNDRNYTTIVFFKINKIITNYA